MKQRLPVLLAGAFGGCFANILGVALLLAKGAPLPQYTFVYALIIFALLGAGVTLVWEETVLRKAFYLGIGLPSLLQVSIGNITAPPADAKPNRTSAISFFVTPAHAQPGGGVIPGRRLQIAAAGVPELEVVFLSGDAVVERAVWSAARPGQPLQVPASATHVRVTAAGVASAPANLPPVPGQAIEAVVEVREKKWSGFLQGIGVRNAQEREVVIRLSP